MGRNYKEINQLKLPPLYRGDHLAFGFTVKINMLNSSVSPTGRT